MIANRTPSRQPWLSRLARLKKQPPFYIIRAALDRLPMHPLTVNRLHLLRYRGIRGRLKWQTTETAPLRSRLGFMPLLSRDRKGAVWQRLRRAGCPTRNPPLKITVTRVTGHGPRKRGPHENTRIPVGASE